MDIRAEKLWLIEHLIKIENEGLIQRIKVFIENITRRKPVEEPGPMSLETFYSRIEESQQALERGEVITQEELRKEIATWEKT